jgi:hypothetical protein
MNGLEALATAIMWREGEPGFRPPARSFRNCNPGNLRSPASPAHDPGGFSIYPTFVGGFNALLDDLAEKFEGRDEHGLCPTSTLLELMDVYAPGQDGNDPNSYAAFCAGWITSAIGRPITVSSTLASIWTPLV